MLLLMYNAQHVLLSFMRTLSHVHTYHTILPHACAHVADLRFFAQNLLNGIDMNVHVLTTGFWPTQAAAKCNLPPEVLNCCDVFKKFYLSNHNGRRLTWQTNMVSEPSPHRACVPCLFLCARLAHHRAPVS